MFPVQGSHASAPPSQWRDPDSRAAQIPKASTHLANKSNILPARESDEQWGIMPISW
jgi:hypothetical protein